MNDNIVPGLRHGLRISALLWLMLYFAWDAYGQTINIPPSPNGGTLTCTYTPNPTTTTSTSSTSTTTTSTVTTTTASTTSTTLPTGVVLDIWDALGDAKITTLQATSAQINLATLPSRILGFCVPSSGIAPVALLLTRPSGSTLARTESSAPYCVHGDMGSDITGETILVGIYRIAVTPLGQPTKTYTITFTDSTASSSTTTTTFPGPGVVYYAQDKCLLSKPLCPIFSGTPPNNLQWKVVVSPKALRRI